MPPTSPTVPQKITDPEQVLLSLAQDITRDIEDIETILERYGLTRADYDKLALGTGFKVMLGRAAKDWGDANNTPARIKLKAAIIVEKAMPELFAILGDRDQALAPRVELFKTFAKIGELGNAPLAGAGNAGQTFRLELNFGDPKKNVTIEHQSAPSLLLPEVMPQEVQFGTMYEIGENE